VSSPLGWLAGLWILGSVEAAEQVLGDFEGTDFGNWHPIGAAFGTGPNQAPPGSPGFVGGFRGGGRASSNQSATAGTGVLRSEPIVLRHRYLNLLIAGPADERRAGVRILSDGRVVRILAGLEPSFLNTATLDLADLVGTRIVVEVFDDDPSATGVVHVDQITLSDQPNAPPRGRIPAS
jgi:hypothetical protein